ncbi:MAG: hypothetical protein HY809_02555 [Nitrospirae bacterium]|nr:hypothetical protein [Nitrospirota bacterium]
MNSPEDRNELGWIAGKLCPLKDKRVFDRRTRRDRRRVWKNPDYAGPQRRHLKRRMVMNRRHVFFTDEDGKVFM